ncbi:MAG TPA: acyl-CoA thioesterase/BAAT N-terminal domain-containing protein [Pseudonocardiaceae bacterium]|nr:acyl-CoA thioesterase/BAAT N-terminal domain-containing protein [Pseudonocardiaceae bacterium]
MTTVAVAVAVVAVVWGSVARPGGGHPRLVVDASTALADQPVRVRVTGPLAGQQVTIVSSTRDYTGQAWHGEATFDADTAGIVDPGRTAPTDGTCRGVEDLDR